MRVRRHLPERWKWNWRPKLPRLQSLRLPRMPKERRTVGIAIGVLVIAGVFGYLLAALVIFPAPIFAESHSMPRLLGMTRDDARHALEQQGLRMHEGESRPDLSVPAGSILWQDPPPDVLVPQGTEVTVTASSGPPRIPVPDVSGYDSANARTLITSAGLTVGRVEEAQAPVPKDVAVNTRPPAGTPLLPDSKITLVVSVGAPTITVPKLLGKTLDAARTALDSAGLVLGTYVARTVDTVAAGTIIEQQPNAGTLSAPGTAIDLIIARKPRS